MKTETEPLDKYGKPLKAGQRVTPLITLKDYNLPAEGGLVSHGGVLFIQFGGHFVALSFFKNPTTNHHSVEIL